MKARVLGAEVAFSSQPFARPLILSTGEIREITQADAWVRVVVDGREAVGRGCMYLSDLWAWPDAAIPHAERDAALRAYCELLALGLPEICGSAGHPLALGLLLHDRAVHDGEARPPALARSMCASAFDAAIHDAVGRALGCGGFAFYAPATPIPEADALFGGPGDACRAIQAMLVDPPRTHSPSWWIVGKADDLERDVRPHAERLGLFAFKLKIMGRDPREDAARVAEVARAARSWGVGRPRLTIDSNEANPDAASVAAFLDELEGLDAAAYEALEMIEQPTGRDIAQHAFDWRDVARRKPVMVDEGLLTAESMRLAKEQGWSGFALKTCKGHSFALAAAAWAHREGMLLSLQDLTNPGAAAVHAAMFAAYVPTINGVELNSQQFTPDANAGWVDLHPRLFGARDGSIELPGRGIVGLGAAGALS